MITLEDLPKVKTYRGETVHTAQRKYDGLRVLLLKRDGTYTAHTRHGKSDFASALLCIPRIRDQLEWLPSLSALDCELHLPERPASDVKTALIGRSNELHLTAFAVPFLGGDDLRQVTIPEAMIALHVSGWEDLAYTMSSHEAEDWIEFSRAKRWEGVVLKESHYHGWYKLKVENTVDCVVTGVTFSESITRPGALKAVQVSVLGDGGWMEIASVGSGFDEDFRWDAMDMDLMGRVCEVRYDSVLSQGRLRFPRFVRWREDKVSTECTFDQLIGDSHDDDVAQ